MVQHSVVWVGSFPNVAHMLFFGGQELQLSTVNLLRVGGAFVEPNVAMFTGIRIGSCSCVWVICCCTPGNITALTTTATCASVMLFKYCFVS